MGVLTIADRNAPCESTIDWPVWYMNDYSVLGLLVTHLTNTLAALEEGGYKVIRKTNSAKVYFENHDRFLEIFKILKHRRIEYCTSDLANSAYQG